MSISSTWCFCRGMANEKKRKGNGKEEKKEKEKRVEKKEKEAID